MCGRMDVVLLILMMAPAPAFFIYPPTMVDGRSLGPLPISRRGHHGLAAYQQPLAPLSEPHLTNFRSVLRSYTVYMRVCSWLAAGWRYRSYIWDLATFDCVLTARLGVHGAISLSISWVQPASHRREDRHIPRVPRVGVVMGTRIRYTVHGSE